MKSSHWTVTMSDWLNFRQDYEEWSDLRWISTKENFLTGHFPNKTPHNHCLSVTISSRITLLWRYPSIQSNNGREQFDRKTSNQRFRLIGFMLIFTLRTEYFHVLYSEDHCHSPLNIFWLIITRITKRYLLRNNSIVKHPENTELVKLLQFSTWKRLEEWNAWSAVETVATLSLINWVVSLIWLSSTMSCGLERRRVWEKCVGRFFFDECSKRTELKYLSSSKIIFNITKSRRQFNSCFSL